MVRADKTDPMQRLSEHHARLGWLLLALFGFLGLVLESLHGFKLQYYVGVDNETRRQMWKLAHAHGTLLAIVQLGFAFSLTIFTRLSQQRSLLASRLLTFASVCMPLGFFLGGLQFYEGDPGLGILLVPVGALALILGALTIGLSSDKGKPAVNQ